MIDKFSHNDLNYNNILIVKVVNNEFINFNYVLNDKETIIIKRESWREEEKNVWNLVVVKISTIYI